MTLKTEPAAPAAGAVSHSASCSTTHKAVLCVACMYGWLIPHLQASLGELHVICTKLKRIILELLTKVLIIFLLFLIGNNTSGTLVVFCNS